MNKTRIFQIIGISTVILIIVLCTGCGGGGGSNNSCVRCSGTWNENSLGSGPSWNAWNYGTLVIDNNGNASFTSIHRSDGDSSLPDGVTFSITADGFVTNTSNSSMHGFISLNKQLIVLTHSPTSSDREFIILQKAGGSFTTSDLIGTWNENSLGSGPSWHEWSYGTLVIDNNGNASFTSIHRSDGDSSLPDGVTFSITADGFVTNTSNPSMHGFISLNKQLIVLTHSPTSSDRELIVLQK
jgi:hypothetical protein